MLMPYGQSGLTYLFFTDLEALRAIADYLLLKLMPYGQFGLLHLFTVFEALRAIANPLLPILKLNGR